MILMKHEQYEDLRVFSLHYLALLLFSYTDILNLFCMRNPWTTRPATQFYSKLDIQALNTSMYRENNVAFS